jgi:arginyl-tRNA synthetase
VTPDQLSDAFVGALRDLVEADALGLRDGVPDQVLVERSRSPEHGDYASNVALQLAGRADLPPRELAGLLAARLESTSGVETVEVSGPGFLNVRLAAGTPGEVAARVVAAGPSYGGTADVMDSVIVPEELVLRLGVDAARYATARHGTGTALDLDLWSRASTDNPVYDVQHAYARACSIRRGAAALGIAPAGHPALLTGAGEHDLLLALADYPQAVAAAARLHEPRRVTGSLEEISSAFRRFADAGEVLPVGDEEPAPLHEARLLLVTATRIVLANGLGLLGVSAPERM